MTKKLAELSSQTSLSVATGPTPYVYRVVIEPDEDRYYAEVPTLLGCYSWGYTYEETLKNIKEAVEVWLEVKKEAGEPIPIESPQTIKKAPLTVGVFA
jgi:predicted RNase H-like HicB family nuclease